MNLKKKLSDRRRSVGGDPFTACACMQGGHITYFLEFQDPFTCQDPFLVGDRRIVSLNEGRRPQRRGSHMCLFPRGQARQERNGPSGSAGTPAATAHWDDSERARSLARSSSRARSSAASLAPSAVGATGIAAVELDARSRGTRPRAAFVRTGAKACRPTQRASSRCPGTTAGLPGGLPGSTASPESAPRSAHWGWSTHSVHAEACTDCSFPR